MIPIRTSSPFELVAFDLMGPISPGTDADNRYILVIVDHFTKWAEDFALKDQTDDGRDATDDDRELSAKVGRVSKATLLRV